MRVPSLTNAHREFINHCRAKSLSPHTIRAYTADLADFRAYLGPQRRLRSITARAIEGYVEDALGRRALSPATVHRRLACIKVFVAWSGRKGYLSKGLSGQIDFPIKLPKRLPKVLTRAELKRLLRVTVPRKSVRGTRRRLKELTRHLAVALMASTGVRVAELVAIRVIDVEPDVGKIEVRGKGNRERAVFVVDAQIRRFLAETTKLRGKTAGPLDSILVNARGAPISTASVRVLLVKAATSAGVTRRITPHMLRHTAATLLLEQGVDIRFVQRLLGHQSIATTEIYTHVSDTNLRDALARANAIAAVRAR